MPSLSIIVPCHDEAQVLPLFYDAARAALAELPSDVSTELIFVDDGSTDETLEVLLALAEDDPRVRYLSFSRHFGKEAALYSGLQTAQGEYVALIDADLQDPPKLLVEMYQTLRADPTLGSVIARRRSRRNEPMFRRWGARAFYWLMRKISDVALRDGERDFRMMTRQVADAVLSLSERNRFSKGMFGWVGFKTAWVEFDHAERAAGATHWSFLQLASYSIEGIVNYSTTPLQIASWSGIIFFLLSLIGALIIIAKTLILNDPVPGWPSLACLILCVGGIQLFCIGIIGQYLLRTYIEAKERPLFIIAQSNCKENSEA